MNIALSSLAETQNSLLQGHEEKYFSDEQFTEAWRIACRALKAGNRLHTYLRNCPKKKKRPLNQKGKGGSPDAKPSKPS